MKHGSLFSGIGGFDLASEWMGWDNVFNCEIEEFPKKILNYYWPNAITYEDIKSTDFTVHRGQIDILTGGFPCQPYSVAGKRKGKNDERHLWPEMLRAIREISPRWVVGENVRGLINWNGGLVFEEVQSDLEAEGYEVQPFILPAASVGAPHRRDRIWFVAYSENNNANRFSKYRSNGQSFDKSKRKGIWSQFGDFSEQKSSSDTESIRWDCGKCGQRENFNQNKEWICKCRQERSKMGAITQRFSKESDSTDTSSKGLERGKWGSTEGQRFASSSKERDVADTDSRGLERSKEVGWDSFDVERKGEFRDVADTYGRRQPSKEHRQEETRWTTKKDFSNNWQNFPTQSPLCGGDDGLPTELDGITFPKWRNESIKGYGNAVVPQVVYQIFKAIQEYENTRTI